MISYLKRFIATDEISFREKVYRIICIMIQLECTVNVVEALFIEPTKWTISAYIVTIVLTAVGQYLVIRRKKLDIAVGIITVLVSYTLLPLVFFMSGGISGGAATWFIIGMLLIFMLYDGVKLWLHLVLAVIVDVLCYVVAYNKPELIVPITSRYSKFFDSAFAILICGFTAGLLFMIQKVEHEREKGIIEKQRKALVEVNKSKDEFYSNFSHEIRNPLNAIIGLNELTARRTDDEEIIANSDAIERSGKLLLNLVGDILDLSQIRMGSMRLDIHPYKTREIFDEITDIIAIKAKEKNLNFVIEIDPNIPGVMEGDDKRITQILLNLLTNAVKYTFEGEVKLSIVEERRMNDTVRIRTSVSDTGIGIKKENIAHLFETYKRFDGEINASVEGHGLGLSIAKELVDMMNGELTVDSVYTKGTTFTFIVDQKAIGPSTVGDLDILGSNSRKKTKEFKYEHSFEAPEARVLVVDDDELNRKVVMRLLASTGLKMDEAESGKKALKLTSQKNYSVILLDYMMPEMNGLETLKAIRAQDGGLCRETPAIALTGATMPEYEKNQVDMLFSKSLMKPITGAILEKSILACLPEELVEYKKDSTVEVNREIEAKIIKERKSKVRITIDCACDLPKEIVSDNDIDMMYLYIRTENARFMDTIEVDSNNLSGFLTDGETKVRPDSASVDEYERFFGEELNKAQEIIHLSLGSTFGNSYNTALKAAEGFSHVHVIDTEQISGGLGLLALTAAKWVREGKNADEICENLLGLRKYVVTNFVLPLPDLFNQKGLIGTFATKALTVFKLHPVLHIAKNTVVITMTMIGNQNAMIRKHVRYNMLYKSKIMSDTDVIFNHVGLSVRQQDYALSELKRYFDKDKIIISRASVSVACCVGMGAISMAFYWKNPYLE